MKKISDIRSCMNKKISDIRSCLNEKISLSTPMRAYGIGFLLAIIMYLLSFCPGGFEWGTEVLKNLAFGVFASTLVSGFIDYANTKKRHADEGLIYKRLVADLKYECENFPSEITIAVYESIGYEDNHQRTFTEWVNDLIPDQPTSNQKKEIDYLLQQVESISKAARRVSEELTVFYNNENVTDDVIKTIKRIIYYCEVIGRKVSGERNYVSVRKTITDSLVVEIVKLFPELQQDFEVAYNEKRYEP